MAIEGTRRAVSIWFIAGLVLTASEGCKSARAVSLDPPSWNFGTVTYGAQVNRTITITNTSGYVLQIVSTGPGPETRLEGVPILNLPPGATAPLGFTFRPSAVLRQQQVSSVTTGFDLIIGGHAGGSQGDLYAEVSYEVTGQIVPFDGGVGPTCNPGPDGDTVASGGILPNTFANWSQQGYACVSVTSVDGGISCGSPADCPAYCCACPSDCAGFTAQACVRGSCAPSPVACELSQMLAANGLALCPDGGGLPSSMDGALGFTVGGSGAQLSTTLTVTLAPNGLSACRGPGAAPGLSIVLPASPSIQPGLFEIAPGVVTAILDTPGSGLLNAVGGYVLLTGVDHGEATGSFDLLLPVESNSEVWGAFNASTCP